MIYAAVVVRAAAWIESNPPVQGMVVWLLVIFGLLLFSEPLITRRLTGYPSLYLILQSGLILALLLQAPGMDFLPALFYPLSFQAVTFFKRRLGFLWIGAFSLAMTGPLLLGWKWQLPGLAAVLISGGTSFLVGNIAHLIQKAEQSRQENQRLLKELEAASRQLQEQAAQVEEYAATQERSRLARELHDSVTQTLFSMNLTVQGAQLLAGKAPGRVAEQLDRLQELSHSAAGEIQVLVSQLRPRPVIEEGLIAALRRLASEREKRDGVRVGIRWATWGNGSIICGKLSASKNWFWKSGSVGSSNRRTRRATSCASCRLSTFSRAMRAPSPAELPTAKTFSSGQSGIMPSRCGASAFA
ncbi:MAG TPA: histidine kinase, partial [Anaerolineales bacterium]